LCPCPQMKSLAMKVSWFPTEPLLVTRLPNITPHGQASYVPSDRPFRPGVDCSREVNPRPVSAILREIKTKGKEARFKKADRGLFGMV
jgi:hypothetical protein